MKSWPKDFWFLLSSLWKSNECQMFQWNVFISSTVVDLSQTATMHFIYYCTGVKRCSADLYESWRLFRLFPFNSERPIKQALRTGPCSFLQSYTLYSSVGATYFIFWLSYQYLQTERRRQQMSNIKFWDEESWPRIMYMRSAPVSTQGLWGQNLGQ